MARRRAQRAEHAWTPETIAFMLDHGEAKAVIVDPSSPPSCAKALALRQSRRRRCC